MVVLQPPTGEQTSIKKVKAGLLLGEGGGWEGATTRKEGKFSNYQQNKKVFFFKKRKERNIYNTQSIVKKALSPNIKEKK